MPTIQDVFDGARAALQGGSTNPAWGLGNAVLQPFLNQAYSEMWQAMEQLQVARATREFYFLVPAYTSLLDPTTAGVTDMGEPEQVWERGGLTSVQIASTDISTPIQVTTVGPHGLTTNAEVTIGQVTGTRAPWGRWFVTVIDSTHLTLNGSVSDGGAGIGGALTTSSESFGGQVVWPLKQTIDRPQSTRLLDYLWEEGVFKLIGATVPAQIRVMYSASATVPGNATATLGVSGADTFLSVRTASLMARSRGNYELAAQLKAEALGQAGESDGSGGLLRTLLSTQVKNLQRNTYRKRPYRSNFNTLGDWIYGSASTPR
jgi:hypothetical protein